MCNKSPAEFDYQTLNNAEVLSQMFICRRLGFFVVHVVLPTVFPVFTLEKGEGG